MAPLDGLQVIDLTVGVAGPMTAMILGDFGADVVKVEPPGGDPGRKEPGFAALNRGKRSLVLDASSPGDRQELRRYLAGADVVLVKDASALDAFGIASDELSTVNPGLVLAELPPYASNGQTPWLGGHESHGLLAAHSGLAWRQASFDGNPVEAVRPQFLYAQAIWAAACIVSALVERERSQWGQRVEVSALNGLMVMATSALSTWADSPDPNTAIGVAGRHPTYTRFQARDGGWLGVGGLGVKFETSLLEVLGVADILEDPRVNGLAGLLEPTNYSWISDRIRAAFATRDRDEWLAIIDGLGIPCGPVAATEDWLDHPQLAAIGLRAEVSDPERGTVLMPGLPLTLTGSAGAIKGPAPELDDGRGRISPRSRPPQADRTAPITPGPLHGYRVLDLGTFVAGPFTGCLLAELGADVIKVEPIAGDPFRNSGFTYNRGMRSLAIDLKSKEGQAALHRLIARSDAIVNAQRPGIAASLGIDHETLVGVNPEIITVGLSGFGETGPLAHKPGVDMVIQGMSGMMSSQGGDSEPVCNALASIDTASGAMGVLTVALALLERARHGHGQHASYSLIGTATYLQFCELVRFPGRTPPEKGSRDHKGSSPLDRYYETADGWIRVEATNPGSLNESQAAILGLGPAARSGDGCDLTAALAQRFASLTNGEALGLLATAGIPAMAARKITHAQRDEQLLELEFVHARPSADDRVMFLPGRYARFSRTQRRGPMKVDGPGEASTTVLRDAGLTDEEIRALAAAGTIAVGQPTAQKLYPLYR